MHLYCVIIKFMSEAFTQLKLLRDLYKMSRKLTDQKSFLTAELTFRKLLLGAACSAPSVFRSFLQLSMNCKAFKDLPREGLKSPAISKRTLLPSMINEDDASIHIAKLIIAQV